MTNSKGNTVTIHKDDDSKEEVGKMILPGEAQDELFPLDGYINPDALVAEEELPMDKVALQTARREKLSEELVSARQQLYGDPVAGFERTAKVWSGILGIEVAPWQVALCQAGSKLVRTAISPDYADSSEDVYGYMDIFTDILGDDMIHARTPDAYVDEKVRRGR